MSCMLHKQVLQGLLVALSFIHTHTHTHTHTHARAHTGCPQAVAQAPQQQCHAGSCNTLRPGQWPQQNSTAVVVTQLKAHEKQSKRLILRFYPSLCVQPYSKQGRRGQFMLVERACACVCAQSCPTLQSCGLQHPQRLQHTAPLSMGSPRQEYWSGLPFPTPGVFLSPYKNRGLGDLHKT